MFFFFFSSRRRHTRFDCDWSSDVCSSDLARCARRAVGRRPRAPTLLTRGGEMSKKTKMRRREFLQVAAAALPAADRKSTRLNSSHSQISYAVFCLKKKKKALLIPRC